VAPIQVVIVPISVGNWKETVLPVARQLKQSLEQADLRVILDDRAEYTPGWKFSEWEMRGVPLRLEVGPRDIKTGQVITVRRDTMGKASISLTGIESRVKELLVDIQKAIFDRALTFQKENTREVSGYEEFKKTIEEKRGFVKTFWCGGEDCEARIKEETMATIRVIPVHPKEGEKGLCVCCQKEAKTEVVFARAY
jgi:prolyl-tRNA synthetase